MKSNLDGVKYSYVAHNRGYKVFVFGMHVATFVPDKPRSNYFLVNLKGERITIPGSIRYFVAVRIAEFDYVISQAKVALPEAEKTNPLFEQLNKIRNKNERVIEMAFESYTIIETLKSLVTSELGKRINKVIDYVEGK